MHRTAIRLLTTAAAVAALALPTHASWDAPARAATAVKWAGPDFDAARLACAYQHNQTDLAQTVHNTRMEYPSLALGHQLEPASLEYPNIVGFMDYIDDACMDS